MYKLCRINIDDRKKIDKDLKDFIKRLKEKFPISSIYLFGSFATGDIHEGSDIDLLIIGNFKERFIERIGIIMDLTNLPIEPLVYTEEEFQDMIDQKNPFITEILKYAKKI